MFQVYTPETIDIARAAIIVRAKVKLHTVTCTMTAAARTYVLEVADTDEARKLGLSGRPALAKNAGMLFVFPDSAPRSIVMRGMCFSIDIVWLDAEKRIVYIQENARPESYPSERFCPDAPAHYVIELSAGEAAAAGLRVGQELVF